MWNISHNVPSPGSRATACGLDGADGHPSCYERGSCRRHWYLQPHVEGCQCETVPVPMVTQDVQKTSEFAASCEASISIVIFSCEIKITEEHLKPLFMRSIVIFSCEIKTCRLLWDRLRHIQPFVRSRLTSAALSGWRHLCTTGTVG